MQGTYLVVLGIRLLERLHLQLHQESTKSRTLIALQGHDAKEEDGGRVCDARVWVGFSCFMDLEWAQEVL